MATEASLAGRLIAAAMQTTVDAIAEPVAALYLEAATDRDRWQGHVLADHEALRRVWRLAAEIDAEAAFLAGLDDDYPGITADDRVTTTLRACAESIRKAVTGRA